MCEDAIPKSLVRQFIDGVRQDLACAGRWLDPTHLLPAEKIVASLQTMLEDPVHRWVDVADAARLIGKSQETVRRQCRTDTAPFRFVKEASGRYAIWLPDLHTGERQEYVA